MKHNYTFKIEKVGQVNIQFKAQKFEDGAIVKQYLFDTEEEAQENIKAWKKEVDA
jgi:hypothetical protein